MTELDALFTLPLAEFTAARNALVKKLKQAERDDEAKAVKALAKPSVSAWAVNQLYWKHRKDFDQLLAAGKVLQKVHAAQLAGKSSDLWGAMDARRETVSLLLQRADKILSENGHASTPDTIRRIQTTLETLSNGDTSSLGRLTEDLAPLGFETLAALAPSNIKAFPRKEDPKVAARKLAEQKLRDAQGAADSAAKDVEEAEEQLARAITAAEEAGRRLTTLRAKAEKAQKAVKDAERDL